MSQVENEMLEALMGIKAELKRIADKLEDVVIYDSPDPEGPAYLRVRQRWEES